MLDDKIKWREIIMSYLNENLLLSYANKRVYSFSENKYQADKTVFLSHSHKDRKLVTCFINYLAEKGVNVYVDWNDSEMPSITNKETAQKIKDKIKGNTLFWIFATKNAMSSRWVPWETGVADQLKKYLAISVIPVADPNGIFDGNEYMQLYRRIIISDANDIAIFEPNEKSGDSLRYFTKNASI
jgi:phage anti-repressor protein